MDPGSNSHGNTWLSDKVEQKHEWTTDDPVHADMRDTEPMSDVGTGTTSMGLTLGGSDIVTIGLSSDVTNSNLEVSNNSSPDIYDYHKITMDHQSTDISTDYTQLNSSSLAILDHDFAQHPKESVDVTLDGYFFDPYIPWDVKHEELSASFRYNIYGEL